MATQDEFVLRAVLQGHTMDVRAVAVTEKGDIITGSRDLTAKLWSEADTPAGFEVVQTFSGHSKFVGCVAYIPEDTPGAGTALILTGSNDWKIRGFRPLGPDPLFTLEGHTNTVCSLAGSSSGTVVSGSWDHTARIWVPEQFSQSLRCKAVLEGHTGAVWAVAVVNETNLVLTGAADKLIMIWDKAGTLQKKLTGHQDVVRGFAVIPDGSGFISASNDATIRRWTLPEGVCVMEFAGHVNYVYSVALFTDPTAGFVSCGEDGTLRVWTASGDLKQQIDLPVTSAWSCAVLPNDDIVVGTNDGICRVFTLALSGRAAPQEVREAFGVEVDTHLKAKSGSVGGIKISELPGPEALLVPGKKEGQRLMVRQGAIAVLYSWIGGKWDRIGDIVGANETEGVSGENKSTYEGREYDFVFSVDIEDGKPALKLPYNMTEDPWRAAQAFVHKHQLPQVHLDVVAKFIIENTKHRKPLYMAEGRELASDPLTGGSRYIPGTSTPSAFGNGIQSGINYDPMTQPSRYIPGTASDSAPKRVKQSHSSGFKPQEEFVSFEACNVSGLQAKLQEFCKEFNTSVGEQGTVSLVNYAQSGEVPAGFEVEVLLQMIPEMLQWPTHAWIPVLDIWRLMLRYPEPSKYYFSPARCKTTIDTLLDAASDKDNSNLRMLALRCFTNAFLQPPGLDAVLEAGTVIIAQLFEALMQRTLDSKPAEVAGATLLLNFIVALTMMPDKVPANSDHFASLLAASVQAVKTLQVDEAVWRALLALGTLIVSQPDLKYNLTAGGDPFVLPDYSQAGWKVKEVGEQIQAMLK